MRYDEEVDELEMNGYDDMKRIFVDVYNGGDDDEEKKKGFWMRNRGWINHEAFSGV